MGKALMIALALLIPFVDPGAAIAGGARLGEREVAAQSKEPRSRAEMEAWIEAVRSTVKSHLDREGQMRFDREFYPEQTVKQWLGGTSNVLIVAPHGYPGDDDHTDYLGYFLGRELDASYLINNKAFYKPGKNRFMGEAANLNQPWSPNPHTRRFMEQILDITRETGKKCDCTPIVIAVHGMSDANAKKYGAGDYALGAGYAMTEREAAFGDSGSATASRQMVDGLLRGLKAQGHPVTDGVPQYCAKRAIPAFLKHKQSEIGPVHAVQIEVRYLGFRDPPSLLRTARSLAAVIRDLPAYKGSK